MFFNLNIDIIRFLTEGVSCINNDNDDDDCDDRDEISLALVQNFSCPSNFTGIDDSYLNANKAYSKTALEHTADVTVANTRFQSCRNYFKFGDMSLQGSSSLS